MRTCVKCGLTKDETLFPRKEGYLAHSCKACTSAASVRRYHASAAVRQQAANNSRLRLYGVPAESWMQESAKGCAVCGGFDRLSVDHDHQTQQPRGVLCSRCNTAFGLLKEDPNRILGLLAYALVAGKVLNHG